MKAAKDIALSQSLHTCFRSNEVVKKRLCHTGLDMGLFIPSHLTRDLVPHSVANLIPGTVWTEEILIMLLSLKCLV